MSRDVWLRAAAMVAVAGAMAACSRSSTTPANTASAAPPPATVASPAPAAATATAEAPEVITTPASMPAPGATGDCPFVGPLQAFAAQQPALEVRTYDTWDFWVADGAARKSVPKSGQFCEQIYRLKPGTTRLSGLEIMSNYEQSMAAAGAEVTNPWRAHDDDLYVKLTKGGAVYWIEVSESNGDTITVHEIGMVPFTRTLQAPRGDDFHLLGHMPQTTPRPPVKTNYDEVSFDVANGTGTKPVKVRGYHYKMVYDLPSDRHMSGLESQLNYRAALKDLGAQILYADPGESPGETTARLNDGGKTVWISVTSNAAITVDTLTEKPFELTVKPPQASDMKTALDRDGHVTLYINFDFNKATLKPDAAPIIAQIVALLKANPTLKLSIDGYTDGVGLHDYNVKLSQARAAAVVAALQAQSIAPGRLASAGYGPDKPIAPNDTDDGRAKNRRVELVKM
jgi:outer membrane protein OmpA-like peptidoglycan-associated protein